MEYDQYLYSLILSVPQTHPSSVMTVPISLPISAADLVNSSPMHGDGSTMVASPTSVSETTAGECVCVLWGGWIHLR